MEVSCPRRSLSALSPCSLSHSPRILSWQRPAQHEKRARAKHLSQIKLMRAYMARITRDEGESKASQPEILRPKSHVWCSHTTARASLGTSIAGVVPRGPGATAGVLRCPPGCTVVARATKNTPNRLVIAVFAGFLKRAARGGFPGLRRTGPRPPKRPPGTQPAPRCRALAQSSADSLQP